MKDLFPEDISRYSVEAIYAQNRVKGKGLYILILGLIFVVLILLPLIKIDISFAARGILRTSETPGLVIAPRGGIVERSTMTLNSYIDIGDTLLILEHKALSTELEDLQSANKMISLYIKDLKNLLNHSGTPLSPRYQLSYSEYMQQTSKHQSDIDFRQEEFNRSQMLYNEGFIAKADHEVCTKHLMDSKNSFQIMKEQYYNQWQAELDEFKLENLSMNTRFGQLKKQLQDMYICAQTSGVIADHEVLKKGSYIASNEVLARIIPKQELIATCFIPPEQIARIRVGQEVLLSIDAYPGSTYGRLNARVMGIPEDASYYSERPVYIVFCSIEQQAGSKKKHDTFSLRSGMTLSGLFKLSRRSLLELLIEKVDKLISPGESLVPLHVQK